MAKRIKRPSDMSLDEIALGLKEETGGRITQESNIKYGKDAKRLLLQGVSGLSRAVKPTLGPNGRNAMFWWDGVPRVTKDGVTVARQIEFNNPIRRMGADLVKAVASKTVEVAGDGTTTATILAEYLIENSINFKGNLPEFERGMLDGMKEVVGRIDAQKYDCDTLDQIYRVAFTSSNNNAQIAQTIRNIYQELHDWSIEIVLEESIDLKDIVSLEQGYLTDRGLVSQKFWSDDNYRIESEKTHILLCDYKLRSVDKTIEILRKIKEIGGTLLLIARDFDAAVLNNILINRERAGVRAYAIKTPGYGLEVGKYLKDMTYAFGGMVHDREPEKMEQYEVGNLGIAEKVIYKHDDTILVSTEEMTEYINARIEDLTNAKETVDDPIELAKIDERIDRLKGETAIFYVGGATEVEMKEKKDRVEDALLAVSEAYREGCVVGGGITYLRVANECSVPKGSKAYQKGFELVIKSLEIPFNVLCDNIGENSKGIQKKLRKDNYNSVYNMKTREYEYVADTNVFDSIVTAKEAIRNAVSIASTILKTECVISNDKPVYE